MPASSRARAVALGFAFMTAALASCISGDNPTGPGPQGLDAGNSNGSVVDAASVDATSNDASTPPADASIDGASAVDAATADAAPGDSSPGDGASDDAAPGDGGAGADAATGFGPATNGVHAGVASADGSAMLLIDNYPRGYLFSHYEPTTGWSTPALLPFNSQIAAYPQLAIDGLGNAYMTWIASSDGGFVADFTRYDHKTNTWATPQVVPAAVDGQEIAFAANSSGEAIVLGATSGAVYAAHYSGGASGTWTQELIALTGGCRFPAMTINDNGQAAAVYDTQGGATTVATRSSGTWTIAGTGFSANAYQVNRAITINAEGDVLAGWEAIPQYSATAYFTSAVPDAGAPVGPVVLPGSSAGSAFGIGGGQLVDVSLTPSGDGTLTHLFNAPTGKNEIDAFAFTKSTKTWGPTQVMPGAARIQLVTFGRVSTGDVFAGFLNTDSTGSGPAVWSDFTPGTGWSAAPTPLSSNTTLNGSAPDFVRLFASPTGSVFAAWDEGNAAFTAKIR